MKNQSDILIIDDSVKISLLLREALESEGYSVLTAGNGKMALSMLRQVEAPSLILLDINMPIMNGNEFLRIIRSDAELRSIPVVVMTASLETKETIGVDFILHKPFDLASVLNLVQKYCPRRHNS